VSTVHVLTNPAARNGANASRMAKVLAALRAHGADCTVLTPGSREEARHELRTLANRAGTRVVVVGGDGLVHLALQELATTEVDVGIIPAGTGNDFAHALGLDRGPLDERVSRALAPARALDAIRTTSGWVASVATIGFAAAVNARANSLRWPRGGSRYTVATVAVLPRLTAVTLTLELDGVARSVDTALLAIANTAYFGGGMAICPDASPDDAMLDIAVIDDVRPVELLRVFPRVFRGTHVTHPKCTMYRARHVRLLHTTTDVWGDGEPLGAAPIELEAVPAAFRVAGVSNGNGGTP
jgi:diacylglycerol kinase (ATP)